MKRLAEVQKRLLNVYEKFNKASEKKLPEIKVDDIKNLTRLLESVHRRESIAQSSTGKSYPSKISLELRKELADCLLLLDGFDIKNNKQKFSSGTEEEISA